MSNFSKLFVALLIGGLLLTFSRKRNQDATLTTEVENKLVEEAPCGASFDMERHLVQFSEKLEAQKILYNSEPLSDCSGIFLRVMRSLEAACTEQEFPKPSDARSSRGLARWYHEQGRLMILEDATVAETLIEPGMVLFYGQSGKTYASPNIHKLTATGSGIQHVGIVTAVEKDAQGLVRNYTLFHGRSSGKIATRTNYHARTPKKGLPPFGNWKQALVAIAPSIPTIN